MTMTTTSQFLLLLLLSSLLDVLPHTSSSTPLPDLSFDPELVPKSFTYEQFRNRPHLVLNGDAHAHVEHIVLAGPGVKQAGSVFMDTAFNLSRGSVVEFAVRISQIQNSGAEGFALVFQTDGVNALGDGLRGMGYAGIGEGLAVEFDTAKDDDRKLGVPHVAVRSALAPEARLRAHGDQEFTLNAQEFAPLPPLTSASEGRPFPLRVVFNPLGSILTVWVKTGSTKSFSREDVDHDGYFYDDDVLFEEEEEGGGGGGPWKLILRTELSEPFRADSEYYVGFTAATGEKDSFARFSLTYFSLAVASRQGCLKDFDGVGCTVTGERAKTSCPRRRTCRQCVQDVYNCAWCVPSSGNDRTHVCVPGTASSLASCGSVAVQLEACGADEAGGDLGGTSLTWLEVTGMVFGVVGVFALALVRFLPRVAMFKAVSLLVGTALGVTVGMMLAYVVAATLVEISSSVFFSFAFGGFFFFQAGLMGVATLELLRARGGGTPLPTELSSSPASSLLSRLTMVLATILIATSGVLCFVLDKRFVKWMPESTKVFAYALLSGSLTFCLVFAGADLANEAWERWTHKRSTHIGMNEIVDSAARRRALAGGARLGTLARSKARLSVLLASSFVAGIYFGYMFARFRVEEEDDLYEASLALKRESAYTFPFGALVGGCAGLALQALQILDIPDAEIDRIMAMEMGRGGGS